MKTKYKDDPYMSEEGKEMREKLDSIQDLDEGYKQLKEFFLTTDSFTIVILHKTALRLLAEVANTQYSVSITKPLSDKDIVIFTKSKIQV